MEEAAFIEPALFNEVIVPLLGVEGTAVLAITTPEQDLDNYFTILMDLKDPETGPVCVLCGMEDVLMTEDQHDSDEDLFKTIRLGLACEACVAAGKGAECTHMAHLAPPWKSASRQSKMREIMKNNKKLFERENLGMISSDAQMIFTTAMVRGLMNAAYAPPQIKPCVLFTAIDPSGGGSQSDYAICSIYIEKGHYTMVGLDRSNTANWQDVNQMVVDHMTGLRKHPVYGTACIVIYIESNFSWLESGRLQAICAQPQFQPVDVISRDPQNKGRVGVFTDEMAKHSYVSELRHILMDTQMSYAQKFVSRNENQVKSELVDQLRQFKRTVKAPNEPEYGGKFKVSYSGKGYGKKDDLVLALMMACYWSAVTRQDEEFICKCLTLGWQVG